MTTIAAFGKAASMVAADVGRFMVAGVIRYGWAVALCPGNGRQEDIDEFLEWVGVRSEARSGMRAIESLLREQA